MFVPTGKLDQVRWHPVLLAATGTVSPVDCPGFGVLRVSGILVRDNQTVIQVGKPNAASHKGCMVNGPIPITLGGYGAATFDLPTYALYDSATGTPTMFETWGTQAESYKLKKANRGFRILGNAGDNRVFVDAQPADLSLPSFGTAAMAFASASLTSTTDTIIPLSDQGTSGGTTFASSTFTCSPAGWYFYQCQICVEVGAAGPTLTMTVRKNGSGRGNDFSASVKPLTVNERATMSINGIVQLADADTLAFYIQSSGIVTWTLETAQASVILMD